jgi:hypothetical protein
MSKVVRVFLMYEILLSVYLAFMTLVRFIEGKEMLVMPVVIIFLICNGFFPLAYQLYIFIERRIK